MGMMDKRMDFITDHLAMLESNQLESHWVYEVDIAVAI
jgi:hypothetical protein